MMRKVSSAAFKVDYFLREYALIDFEAGAHNRNILSQIKGSD